MFVRKILRHPVIREAGNHNCETFARNENEIPQRLFICIKKLRTHQGTEHVNHHLFLLLPRIVASGLAACFMKAEGLMPTMFLNCLEKW